MKYSRESMRHVHMMPRNPRHILADAYDALRVLPGEISKRHSSQVLLLYLLAYRRLLLGNDTNVQLSSTTSR